MVKALSPIESLAAHPHPENIDDIRIGNDQNNVSDSATGSANGPYTGREDVPEPQGRQGDPGPENVKKETVGLSIVTSPTISLKAKTRQEQQTSAVSILQTRAATSVALDTSGFTNTATHDSTDIEKISPVPDRPRTSDKTNQALSEVPPSQAGLHSSTTGLQSVSEGLVFSKY